MPAWTPEEARRNGRLGGQARQRQRKAMQSLAFDERARVLFSQASSEMAKELLKAARGEEPYDQLDVKERLGAVLKCLEYGIGRPSTNKTAASTEPSAEPPLEGFEVT